MKQLRALITAGILLVTICTLQAQSGLLHVEGSFATSVTTTSTSLTLDETHQVVLVNSTVNRTITLPSATGIGGRKYTVKKIGSGNVTLNPQSGQSIDSSGSFIMFGANAFLTVVSDGNQWWVIGRD